MSVTLLTPGLRFSLIAWGWGRWLSSEALQILQIGSWGFPSIVNEVLGMPAANSHNIQFTAVLQAKERTCLTVGLSPCLCAARPPCQIIVLTLPQLRTLTVTKRFAVCKRSRIMRVDSLSPSLTVGAWVTECPAFRQEVFKHDLKCAS